MKKNTTGEWTKEQLDSTFNKLEAAWATVDRSERLHKICQVVREIPDRANPISTSLLSGDTSTP